jgi:4'-phosphopantetheinyl transferase
VVITEPTWPPSPPSFELGPDEVHVWCASLRQSPAQVDLFLRTLSEDERDRAGRTRHAPARHEFIVVRGLLRTILAEYLNVDTRRLAFSSGPTGKPALVEPSGALPLYFNVSHSHDLTLIAVTRRGEVGVDVERLRPFANDLGLAERFFSPGEAMILRALPPDQRIEAFFHAWTRKEAFLKASAHGLTYGLDRVEVTLLPAEPVRFLRIDGQERAAQRWSLHHLTPAPGYVGALAIRGHDNQLVCWRWCETRAAAARADGLTAPFSRVS